MEMKGEADVGPHETEWQLRRPPLKGLWYNASRMLFV